jgi:2-dehydropantoate 2-reductase
MAKVERKLRVAILGSGAVGGFLATILSNFGHKVYCIGRNETVKAINQKGIFLQSKKFGYLHSRVDASTNLMHEVDLLFITVKNPFLTEAIKRIVVSNEDIKAVIPLLNGIEHVETIRNELGNRVVVGMITGEFIRTDFTHLKHTTSHVKIDLASADLSCEQMSKIAKSISETGINVETHESEANVIWEKLVKLNALGCTTAASQKPLGFIRLDKFWHKQLKEIVREGSSVAQADGANIVETKILEKIEGLPDELSTSLQRDIEKGVPSELDSIVGAVLRRAVKYNINCEIMKKLYHDIQYKANFIGH